MRLSRILCGRFLLFSLLSSIIINRRDEMRINSFLFNVEESWKIHISEEEIFEIVWIRKMFVVINYSIFDGITRRILVQFIRTLEEFLINLLLKVEKKSYKRDIRKIFLRKSNERSLTRNTFRSLYKHNYSRLIFLPLDTWNGVGCANRRHTHISPSRYERRNFRPLSARIFQ